MMNFRDWASPTSALAALCLLVPLATTAAVLEGRVTFRAQPIPAALVSFYREGNDGGKAVTITNNNGDYRFGNLAAGNYIVLVERQGRRIYQGRTTVTEDNVKLDIGL